MGNRDEWVCPECMAPRAMFDLQIHHMKNCSRYQPEPNIIPREVPKVPDVYVQNSQAATAVAAIMDERQFQDQKFGKLGEGGEHTLGEWVLLIEAELNEAKESLIKGGTGRNALRSEIVQIAALAVACLEQHGTVDAHGKRQI